MMMQRWHVDQRLARVELDRFSAVVSPLNPAAGLSSARVDGFELPGFQTLEVELPILSQPIAMQGVTPNDLAAVDFYVRGDDLIATYSDQPAPAMRTQVYWRANDPQAAEVAAAIELVVSVQTSRLDSCPRLTTRSECLATEAYRLVDAESATFGSIVPLPDFSELVDEDGLPQCFLFRLPGRQFSYVEMVHPAAAAKSTWEGWLNGLDFRMQLRHQLFFDSLEKGVILRARVLGLLVDRRHDKLLAAQRWLSFLASEVPLTT